MVDESQSRQNLAKKKRYGSPSTRVLVLGILGLIVCQLFSPVAWYVGHQELKAIRSGRSPSSDEGIAKVGMVLGIVGTILLIVGLVVTGFLLYHWEAILQPFMAYLAGSRVP